MPGNPEDFPPDYRRNHRHHEFHDTVTYTDGVDAQGRTIALAKMGKEKVLAEASPGEEVEFQIQTGGGDYVLTVMNPGPRKANIATMIRLNH